VRPVVFAAGRDDPRARRPIDAVRAAVYLALLIVAAVLSVIGENLDSRLSKTLADFSGLLRALFLAALWVESSGRWSSLSSRSCVAVHCLRSSAWARSCSRLRARDV
jgi:hypothetical protein